MHGADRVLLLAAFLLGETVNSLMFREVGLFSGDLLPFPASPFLPVCYSRFRTPIIGRVLRDLLVNVTDRIRCYSPIGFRD